MKIFIEDKEGEIKPFLRDAEIIQENNHEGKLKDARPVRMTIRGNEEIWYIPHKYQIGKYKEIL